MKKNIETTILTVDEMPSTGFIFEGKFTDEEYLETDDRLQLAYHEAFKNYRGLARIDYICKTMNCGWCVYIFEDGEGD